MGIVKVCVSVVKVERDRVDHMPRFDRRAPLIGALMRLHNFCIDERLVEESCMTLAITNSSRTGMQV